MAHIEVSLLNGHVNDGLPCFASENRVGSLNSLPPLSWHAGGAAIPQRTSGGEQAQAGAAEGR